MELSNHEKEKSIKDKESLSSYVYTNTSNESFLPIDKVLEKLVTRTVVDVGDADVLIEDVLCCNLHIPQYIHPKRRRTIYKAMVHCIVLNNPEIELIYILSYIYYINGRFTGDTPMPVQDLVNTVTAEYNTILETGHIKVYKTKRYHTNPKHDRKTRIKLAAQARGKEQVEHSIQLIQSAVKQLINRGEKPTAKKVKNILKKKLSLTSIKRHWRVVIPKNQKPNN